MIQKLIDWFYKQPTSLFKVISYAIISTIFIVWFLLLMGGCASFEKTTGYKQNESWQIRKL